MSGADNRNAQERPLEARALIAASPDAIVVECAALAPIGARVSLDLCPLGVLPAGEAPLHGKVVDVRRAGDGYRIALRLNSVSKAQREALKGAVTSA